MEIATLIMLLWILACARMTRFYILKYSPKGEGIIPIPRIGYKKHVPKLASSNNSTNNREAIAIIPNAVPKNDPAKFLKKNLLFNHIEASSFFD